jgi:hypothetical protein
VDPTTAEMLRKYIFYFETKKNKVCEIQDPCCVMQMPGATREEFTRTGPGAPPVDLDGMSAEHRGRYNFERFLRAFAAPAARVRLQAG